MFPVEAVGRRSVAKTTTGLLKRMGGTGLLPGKSLSEDPGQRQEVTPGTAEPTGGVGSLNQ